MDGHSRYAELRSERYDKAVLSNRTDNEDLVRRGVTGHQLFAPCIEASRNEHLIQVCFAVVHSNEDDNGNDAKHDGSIPDESGRYNRRRLTQEMISVADASIVQSVNRSIGKRKLELRMEACRIAPVLVRTEENQPVRCVRRNGTFSSIGQHHRLRNWSIS